MAISRSETSNAHMTSGASKWLVKALELCLLAGIIYFLIRSLIGFLSPESLWRDNGPNTGQAAVVQNAGANKSAKAQLTNTLSGFDPFHRQRTVGTEIDIITADVPETTLDLRLFGLRAGEEGSAILQTPDKRQGVYKVGEEIIDGVVLKSVSSNYIVMSQSGNLERLTFEREETFSKRGEQGNITQTGLQKSGSLEQGLAAQLANTTPENFLKATSLKPVLERGRLSGFRVGSSSVDVSQFGLQSGDVITHIGSQDLRNGRPQIAKLLSKFQQGQSMKVSIIRNGQPQTIELGQR